LIKTNGQIVVVAVTNQSPSDSVTLAAQLYNAINANAALQGSDGVVAGDYEVNQYGTFYYTSFNLYARSPGYQAAAIQVTPTVSSIQVPAFTALGQHPYAKPVRPPAPEPSLRHGRRRQPGPDLPPGYHDPG
jgi:hypothetical protein